jgi:hypothetical protein
MKWILFEDFEISKWFVLGFCAWLAGLGEGAGMNFNYSPGSNTGEDIKEILPVQEIMNFILENAVLVGVIGVFSFALILGLAVLITWLSSRGKFMFIDGIVKNRGAVTEPWHRFRGLGNNLFVARIILFTAASVLSLVILLVCFGIAWPDIKAETLSGSGITAIILGSISLFVLFLFFFIISLILGDFIALIMYRRGVPLSAALHIFRHRILPGNTGAFVLFYLLKLAMTIGAGLVLFIGACLTCCFLYCITALPYLGSVILLPVSVFFRSYSIFFLGQFGEEWSLFDAKE